MLFCFALSSFKHDFANKFVRIWIELVILYYYPVNKKKYLTDLRPLYYSGGKKAIYICLYVDAWWVG